MNIRIYRERMIGLGFDINHYHVRIWFLCWIFVWNTGSWSTRNDDV
jgi:hypothetical protein